MHVARTVSELAKAPGAVLVATMGALHEGHAGLIRQGAALAKERSLAGCLVTIFVNPTQFNDAKDFTRYPRVLDDDLRLCERAGAAGVFVPGQDEIYPPNEKVPIPTLPAVATDPKLEDAHRPGHFAGVCQVVARLFHLTQPAAAIFGEKDWQQLQVIRAMTAQLNLPIEIVPALTIREEGGLALSSRNRFLSADDRHRALALSRALRMARTAQTPSAAEATMREALSEQSIIADYCVVRDAQTLLAPTPSTKDFRALIAANVGPVRLIDNGPWIPAA